MKKDLPLSLKNFQIFFWISKNKERKQKVWFKEWEFIVHKIVCIFSGSKESGCVKRQKSA